MNENQNNYVDINAHDNYPDSGEQITVPTMKVAPLKKICMTIGELPTSYLETMSYYEMLIWFIEFLRNNIIPTVNNNGEAVQELQGLFIDLQTYINNFKDSIDSDVEELENYMNNYFENLDVQEEINNKLDQMLEDGVLEQIIEQFLQSTAIWSFDTVADMKLATNLIAGSTAKTLGYHSINDLGGSLYNIREKTNDDIINESTLVSILNENLVAELILKDVISPESFGAYGDNTHDDSIILQSVIDYAIENRKNVYGSKTYKIDSTLEITGTTPETNIEINLNKVVYTGNDYAFNITYAQFLTLNVNEVVASTGGGLKSIPATSPERMQYCKISMKQCTYATYGIYIKPTNNRWVNENEFYRSRFFGNNNNAVSVYVEDGVGTSEPHAESNMFRWIANENTNTKTFVFKGAQNTVVEYPRYMESGHLCDTIGTNQVLFILKTQLKNTFFNFSNATYGKIITAKSVYSDTLSNYDYCTITQGKVIPVNENNNYLNVSNSLASDGVVDFTSKDGYELHNYLFITGSDITTINLPTWLLSSLSHPLYLRFGDNAQTSLTFNCGSYSFTYDGVKLTTGHWYRIRFIQTTNKFTYEVIDQL